MGNNSPLIDRLIHLELIKSDNKNTRIKKYLPIVAIAASWYYSIALCGGLVLGYLGSKIYSKYTLEKGKVDSIYIEIGKYKLHLHHWMMGLAVLGIMWFLYRSYLSVFLTGLILGVVAHDFYDYTDWAEILVKNENYKER